MIRYGNDVQLVTLEMELKNQMKAIGECTTNGRLDHAFLIAHRMEVTLNSFKERLNEIKYGT